MLFAEEVTARPTKEFAEAVGRRRAAGGEILSFGLGEPDFETPSYVIDATFQAVCDDYTHYCDAQGLPELRHLIAEDATTRYGVPFAPEEVAVTPGIKSAAYSALAAILRPGDRVALCTPCYVAYPAMIKVAEPTAEIVEVDLRRDYSLDMDALECAVRSGVRALVVNSPNNPTGAMLTREEIERIVGLCLETDTYVISDEVYDRITLRGREHVSFAEYPELKDLLVIANGYSKSHAMTGWRLGYALAPRDVCYLIARLQFNTNTNVATFIQKGACSIYEHPWDHLEAYRDELAERMAYFHDRVNDIPGLSGIMPEGGFFYMVDVSATGLTSNAFAARLVEQTGVATTPGIAFGRSWDTHVRFSLAVPMERIERAADLLESYVGRL